MLKHTIALVFASALSGCVYRADVPPAASSAAARSRQPAGQGETAKSDVRPTQVGIRFYFKEPVRPEWTVTPVTGEYGEAAVTPLCLLANKTTGSRIIFLLKSYVAADADPKAYQGAIMGDSAGWLATLPPAFGSQALFGDEPGSGYVAVGTFEGMDDRWLIAAGRWREADQAPMFADMQAIVGTLTATSTASAKALADPSRQVCYDYY